MIGARRGPRQTSPSRPVRILLTGFGPFPGMPRNPSEALVRRLAATGALRRTPARIDTLVLDTVWRRLDVLATRIEGLRPDVILMVGVQSRDNRVRLERVARRHATRTTPDHAGEGPPCALASDGPMHLRSRLPVPALVAALSGHGMPVRISDDAGAYLCNAGLRTALARRVAGKPPGRAVFVHIPPPRPARGYRLSDLERLVLTVMEEISGLPASAPRRGPARRSVRS